jgi:hypothetical protein
MKMLSGECALIIDGRRFDRCTCALEADDAVSRPCGFLSAPSEVLDRARLAECLQILFEDRPPMAIRVLASNAGIAMFVITGTEPIRATLTAQRWVAVVEGSDVREVCIRAEEKLLERAPNVGTIRCQVTGADPDAAATIKDYVTNLQPLIASDLGHETVSPGVLRNLQLAKLDHSIRKAERLISRQRHCVETLTREGWQHELSTRLLDNLNVSLTLLYKHRDLVQREMVQAE